MFKEQSRPDIVSDIAMTRILVTNQKGGVGKSTISANLSNYFAAVRGRRTALLDLDSQASSSRWVQAVRPTDESNPVSVFNVPLALQMGFSRVLIELRRSLRSYSASHDIVIADLTWNDALDSELLFEFDLVVMPSAVSEVELVTTIEFAQRHQWVFESPRYRPTLVLAPSRVRADQINMVHRSSQRFPFSFVLTPPILDSVDAKRAFAEKFLLSHRNQKLSESFMNFCRAIEQTISIHQASQGSRPERLDLREQSTPSLHSFLKYRVEVDKAVRNAPAEKTIIQVGRPAAVPPLTAASSHDEQPQPEEGRPAVVNGAAGPSAPATPGKQTARPNLSLVGRLFGTKSPSSE